MDGLPGRVRWRPFGSPRLVWLRAASLLAGVFQGRLAYICTIRAIHSVSLRSEASPPSLLRFEFSIPREMLPALWVAIGVWAITKVLVFHLFGLGRGMWRYFNTNDLVRLTKANVVSSASAAVVILIGCHVPFPIGPDRRFPGSMVLSAGVRAATRLALEVASRNNVGRSNRTFIYGAGAGGALLLAEARLNGAFGYVVEGFIDDDPNKRGMLINGVPVRGSGGDLPGLVETHHVRSVLIAIPSATGNQMTAIVGHCQQAGVAFRTMPSLAEMVADGRCAPDPRRSRGGHSGARAG